jgi:hypothetical protein
MHSSAQQTDDARAQAEANVSGWKHVIGSGLHAHTDGRQETEVAIAADALNRMPSFRRPEWVRIG